VKILDFGIARLFDAEQEQLITASGAALGTAVYMAPEQARGDREIDNRADIYALGVIVYEALSGARPFEGDSYNETLFHILTRKHTPLTELRPDLHPRISSLVERALMKDREARFASVESFAQALSEACETNLRPSGDLATLDLETGEQPLARAAPAPALLWLTVPKTIGQHRDRLRRGIGAFLVGATGFALGVAFHQFERSPTVSSPEPALKRGEAQTGTSPSSPEASAVTKELDAPSSATLDPNRTSNSSDAFVSASSRPAEIHRPPVAPARSRPSASPPRDRGF
jgi:serine/threonine-protein kinase